MLMKIHYVPSLVVLSIGVAIFASYVALNLAYSVSQAKGKAQLAWLVGGAVAMGVGIWSMHFVGMLAFEMPGMDMAYDVPLMLLSVCVAILASAVALYIISRARVTFLSLYVGGVSMASAIAGMHYIGMFSMRMAARIQWNIYLVALSIAIALVASFAALLICINLRNKTEKQGLLFLASTLMGIAISGMHYTGMFAATFVHDHAADLIQRENLLVTDGLSVSVVATTLLILSIALMGSVGQRIMVLRTKRSEENLVTSEEKFRHLVEAVKDYAIFLLDSQGLITTWNSGAARITGYTDEEVIGQHFYMLYPFADRTKFDQNSELEMAKSQGRFEAESIHIKKDGTEFWVNIVINPLFQSDGTLIGYSEVTRDITQIKAAAESLRNINEDLETRVRERTLELEAREVELKAAKEAAEVANETKSAFLANMSHEIRTPLGAVIGFSELMLNDKITTAEKNKNIEIIKRNGKLLSGIINDILDLSKVEADKLQIEKTDVHIVDLVNDTVSLLNLEAKEKGIKISISSEGFIPDLVKTDPMRLRQILFNIIGNAVKFTQKGTVEIIVKLSPHQGSTCLAFVVKDSGAGITPEQSARLFSPFVQADVTTTRKFGGTGLGLALSKKLAQALGGDVILETSTPGQGSTFVAMIDHGQMNQTQFKNLDWNEKNIQPGPREKLPKLSQLNILVVDDSLDNQDLIKTVLQFSGAEVETANNGIEAMAKATAGGFDVILMDLQMPVMDGYTATKELRRQGYSRPIIALTAHAMNEERKKCLDNGFDHHVTKPIDREHLIQTLAQYATPFKY
jgi:PAS domain S-box-containing protein